MHHRMGIFLAPKSLKYHLLCRRRNAGFLSELCCRNASSNIFSLIQSPFVYMVGLFRISVISSALGLFSVRLPPPTRSPCFRNMPLKRDPKGRKDPSWQGRVAVVGVTSWPDQVHPTARRCAGQEIVVLPPRCVFVFRQEKRGGEGSKELLCLSVSSYILLLTCFLFFT